MKLRHQVAVCSTFLACAGLCAQDKKRDPAEIGNRKVDGGPNFYSLDRELALGRQLAAEVEKQTKLFDDPIVTEYLSRLGQTIVRHSDVTFPVTIKVIENDQPNAFTLPGGHIFVDTGLIRLSETEAELAAALAHEIGHVAARHATRQATQSKIANLATLPLFVLGGPIAIAGGTAASLGIPMTVLKFSRMFETEADMLGLQYMYNAGYDPSASLDIFERLESMERKKPGAIARAFTSHPQTSDRVQESEKNIRKLLPAKLDYIVNTSDYEAMRSRMTGILDTRKETHKAPVSAERKPTLLKPGEQIRMNSSNQKPLSPFQRL